MTDDQLNRRHVIYLSKLHHLDPEGNQHCVFIYDKRWRVKLAMQLIVRDDELDWRDDNYLETSSGIILRIRPVAATPATLRELWERELKVSEMALELEPHLRRECKIFRDGLAPAEAPERAAKRERKSSAARKPPPSGAVHVKDIALQLGVEPRQARAALRSIMSKPDHGWWFSPSEVDGVKAKIAEAMK